MLDLETVTTLSISGCLCDSVVNGLADKRKSENSHRFRSGNTLLTDLFYSTRGGHSLSGSDSRVSISLRGRCPRCSTRFR